MSSSSSEEKILENLGDYKYGFSDPDVSVFKTRKGLDEQVVRQISAQKGEPQWMLENRLKALAHFQKRPMPNWGADISGLKLDEIYYYVRPVDVAGKSWEDVPDSIKKTFDRLGIREAER